MFTVGVGEIVIVTLSFALQPDPLVPVTVYVVFTVGEAVTLVPVEALNVPEGAHV